MPLADYLDLENRKRFYDLGFKFEDYWSEGNSCRKCHIETIGDVTISPNWAFYHTKCFLQTARAKRFKITRTITKEDSTK